MSIKNEDIIKIALEAIKEHEIAMITYVMPYLPCSQSTFYDKGLEKTEEIKAALFENKIKRKQKLLNKWEKSDNATLNIAAFKLLADEDELRRLNSEKAKEENEGIKVIIEDARTTIEGND